MGSSGMGSMVLGVNWTLVFEAMWASRGTSGGGMEVDPRPSPGVYSGGGAELDPRPNCRLM